MSARSAIARIMGLALCLPAAVSVAQGQSLDRWTEKTLIPYLVEQLGSHPRFRAQPVMLVALRDGEVLARIDGLSAELRERLVTALLDSPGVVLAWRPVNPLPDRSPASLPCLDSPAVAYYIGIEVTAAAHGDALVSVRALDLAESNWVSGFGLEWQGRLDRSQRAALGRSASDDHLRGLRPLPFAPTELDRAAVFLARRIGCALARGAGAGLSVAVAGDVDAPLRALSDLVARYLARAGGLRVVAAGEPADLILRGSEHHLGDDLAQWWVSLEPADATGQDLPSLSAMAYAYPAASSRSSSETKVARDSAHSREPTVSMRTEPATPPVAAPRSYQAELRVLHSDLPRCAEDPHWLGKAQAMDPQQAIAPGDCFEVQAGNINAANRFWLVQRNDGSLVHADPVPGCTSGGQRRPLVWAGQGGFETYFLIAAGDAAAARTLSRQIERLPQDCTGTAGLQGIALEDWSRDLERVLASLEGRVQWQALKLQHTARPLRAGR